MPPAISELTYDGWYYKKVSDDSTNNKINWYIGSDVSMKVSDLHQIFFEMKLINVAKIPFITVYTKPTGSGDYYPPGASANYQPWYKSSRTYELRNPTGLVASSDYCCYMKLNASTPEPVSYGHRNLAMSLTDVVANIRGSFAPTEDILFFSFGTDSSAGVGTVEFIAKSVCIQSSKGTSNFLFSNIHVESRELANQVNVLYQYFFNQNRGDSPPPSRA